MDTLLMTRAEVAQFLGTSERNVTELKGKGKLTGIPVPRNGKPPVHMFERAEVEALRNERTVIQVVPQEDLARSAQALAAIAQSGSMAEHLDNLTASFTAAVEKVAAPRACLRPWWEKPYLTLDQAVEYSNLGRSYIRSRLTGYVGAHNATVYRRADLDTLEPEPRSPRSLTS